MKYKLSGIIAFLLLFILISAALIFTSGGKKPRVHQHLQTEEKAACDHGSDVFCTHLPLVQIDTKGQDIPGEILNWESQSQVTYTTAADGSDYITAEITITDSEGTMNHTEDSPAVSSLAQIHVRGNSSRTFDKLGYAIRLVRDDGKNNPQPVMGMDAHHEWVLHGPYLDKTLIRNYMCYNLAGEIMDYAPNVRFCEVMINGEYQGLYLMTESITAGQDGARLGLSVNKKDNTFTGYLLRLDRGSETDIKNLDTYSMYSLRTLNRLNIVYPGAANLTEEIRRSIELDFSDFEKAIYSYDYDSAKYGYPEFIDIDNFVDYFLFNEFVCNYDAGLYSTYIYKDTDGKYRLCVWDFNNACDNYQDYAWSGDSFELQHHLWYFMLTKSDCFTDRCIERYRELRKTILSDEYLHNYIDETIAWLGPAVDRNNARWSASFEQELLYPAERNLHSYEEAVTQLKDFLGHRTAWMDENIETLRQYSAESKIKKYSEATE